MKLKRTYTFSVNVELAERIEEFIEDNPKTSYTDLFIEAIKKFIAVTE